MRPHLNPSQAVSDSSEGRRRPPPGRRRALGPTSIVQIRSCGASGCLIHYDVKRNPLTCDKPAHSRALHCGHMHEYVRPAGVVCDSTEPLLTTEELHCACGHVGSPLRVSKPPWETVILPLASTCLRPERSRIGGGFLLVEGPIRGGNVHGASQLRINLRRSVRPPFARDRRVSAPELDRSHVSFGVARLETS
jgi:hypothetical protein